MVEERDIRHEAGCCEECGHLWWVYREHGHPTSIQGCLSSDCPNFIGEKFSSLPQSEPNEHE